MVNKFIILLTLVFSSSLLLAQDTTIQYLDYYEEKVSDTTNFEYRRKLYKGADNKWYVKDYYLTGELKKEGVFSSNDLKNGAYKYYYKSGKIESIITYLDGRRKKEIGYHENGMKKLSAEYLMGKMHGKMLTYWDNGTLRREDSYNLGDFVEGKCYNESGEEIEYFPYIKQPELPGGLNKFLEDNFKYPSKAKSKGITGTVYVSFTVNENGKVQHVKIIKGAHPLLDEEALRVTRLLPNWIPGTTDGEITSMRLNLPIKFSL